MRKNELRARIGDFGIARFNDCDVPCLVIGQSHTPNDYKFVYWDYSHNGHLQVYTASLSRHRLIRARFGVLDTAITSLHGLKMYRADTYAS